MIRARCSVSAALSKAPPREGIRMNRVIFEKLRTTPWTRISRDASKILDKHHAVGH